MENQPVEFNMPTHYRRDGLLPFTIALTYPDTEDAVDLVSAKVRMQLRNFKFEKIFEFNSVEGEGDALLTITDNVIHFPEIKSWDIESSSYLYDLEVTDATGFVTTYMRGKWSVNQDITY